MSSARPYDDQSGCSTAEVFAVYRSDLGDSAALQGLNLTLASGELLCVLGPSGAGKTTLLRLIAGVQQPSIGHVTFQGQDIGRLGRRSRAAFRHRHIGALGQSSTTIAPDLPVGRAVELPLALRGVSRQARRARAEVLLDAAGLGDRARALTRELSGGERQRVALCAALAHEPALLLADEPTGELDTQTAGDMHDMIRAMARTARTSVIIASTTRPPARTPIARSRCATDASPKSCTPEARRWSCPRQAGCRSRTNSASERA